MKSEEVVPFKFVVTGPSKHKTSFLRRLEDEPIQILTFGKNFVDKNVQKYGKKFRVFIFESPYFFPSLEYPYFKDSACVLIFYDIKNPIELEEFQQRIANFRDYAPENCHFVIVGNHGKTERFNLQGDPIKSYAKTKGIPYYEVSIFKGYCVQELFDDCFDEVYENYLYEKKNVDICNKQMR